MLQLMHMLSNDVFSLLTFVKLRLLQVLMTRHTVMVVGQTGGGKSVILQTLARAQTKMGKRTTMSILNPKVCFSRSHKICAMQHDYCFTLHLNLLLHLRCHKLAGHFIVLLVAHQLAVSVLLFIHLILAACHHV